MVIPKIVSKDVNEYNEGFIEFDAYILVVENKTGIINCKFPLSN